MPPHPWRSRFFASPAVLLTLLLSSCSTTPAFHPEAERAIGRCNGIYLVKPEIHGGFAHYVIAEVWRHDPAMGPIPGPGSEIKAPLPVDDGRHRPALSLVGETALEEVGSTLEIPLAAFGIANDSDLATVKTRVLAYSPAHGFWPRPAALKIDRLARARGVYLVHSEPQPSGVTWIVDDVWRQDPSLGAAVAAGGQLQHVPETTGIPTPTPRGTKALAVIPPADPSVPSDDHPVLLRIIGNAIQPLGVETAWLRPYYQSPGRPFSGLHIKPSVREQIEQAASVYLALVVHDAKGAHYRVTEVWRQAPGLASNLHVGSLVPVDYAVIRFSAVVDQVILLRNPAPPRGSQIPLIQALSFPVSLGYVLQGNCNLADLRPEFATVAER